MVLSVKQRKAIAAAPPNQRTRMRNAFQNQNNVSRRMPANSSVSFGRQNALAILPNKSLNRRTTQMGRIPRPLGRALPNLGWAFDGFDHRHLPIDEKTAPYVVSNYLNYMIVETSSYGKLVVIAPRVRPATGTGGALNNTPGVYEHAHASQVKVDPPGVVTESGETIYTTVRDTAHWHPGQKTGPMSNIIAYVYTSSAQVGPALQHEDFLECDVLGDSGWLGTSEIFYSDRIRLHNMSAQVECLGASQGLYPKGMLYAGAVPSLDMPDEHVTHHIGAMTGNASSAAEMWATPAMKTGYIRGYSGAALLTKPVQITSAVSETIEYKKWSNGFKPQSNTYHGAYPIGLGLEPILIYIPAVAGVTVQYRISVGTQWCSRHPMDVRLRSKQLNYRPTSPDLWQQAGAHVKDAAQTVAEHAGRAVAGAAAHAVSSVAASAVQGLSNMTGASGPAIEGLGTLATMGA